MEYRIALNTARQKRGMPCWGAWRDDGVYPVAATYTKDDLLHAIEADAAGEPYTIKENESVKA